MKKYVSASTIIFVVSFSVLAENAQKCSNKVTGYDVWNLAKMAQDKNAKLEVLFNNGAEIKTLPTGYAAGMGARVLNLNNARDLESDGLVNVRDGQVHRFLDNLTRANWRGKIFFPCQGCGMKSEGVNRIKEFVLGPLSPVKPMGAFITEVLDPRNAADNDEHMKRLADLVPNITSNVVVLNYANPHTPDSYWGRFGMESFGNPIGGWWQAEALDNVIQVYDVVTKVKGGGAYGPELYIGKTWLGEYDDDGHFYATDKENLVAWFFLDFNECAVEKQKEMLKDSIVREIRIDGRIPVLKKSPEAASY